MKFLLYITRGNAVITGESLRCNAPRLKDSKKLCNKLLCRKSKSGQLAGSFKCSRCSQLIEVEIKEPRKDLKD